MANGAGVYPHGCGGTVPVIGSIGDDGGLSPRVRGNRGGRGAGGWRLGSIPTGAGEPEHESRSRRLQEVYPHGCGGTQSSLWPRRESEGLSPRVRGNRGGCHIHRCRSGSIPTGAGEPECYPLPRREYKVYPHGCGGTEATPEKILQPEGLSPRVRGNQLRGLARPAGPGSIPTGAGEPRPAALPCPSTRVYPHGCGGTIAEMRRFLQRWGLSPRVRGNLRGGEPA